MPDNGDADAEGPEADRPGRQPDAEGLAAALPGRRAAAGYKAMSAEFRASRLKRRTREILTSNRGAATNRSSHRPRRSQRSLQPPEDGGAAEYR